METLDLEEYLELELGGEYSEVNCTVDEVILAQKVETRIERRGKNYQ